MDEESDEDQEASDFAESGEDELSSNNQDSEASSQESGSSSEPPQLVPAKKEKAVEPKIDVLATEKQIRSVLNKVSEGNMDPMFEQITKVVNELMPKDPLTFVKAYSKIF